MYQYFPTRYPGPGTGNYAFDTGSMLPLLQVQGPGIFQRKSYNVRQYGMLTNLSTVTLTDLTHGGYIAGQLIGQPLSQPASATVIGS